MKQTKIDTTCILNIKGEEARFKVVDAVNSIIREINRLNSSAGNESFEGTGDCNNRKHRQQQN